MKPPFVHEIFRYNDWANTRLIQLCSRLGDHDLDRPFEIGHGTLRKTLLHVLAVEQEWLDRWKDAPHPRHHTALPSMSLAALAARVALVARERNAFFAAASSRTLDQPMHVRSGGADKFDHRLGELALHVCNHGVYHRAQASAMLRQLGVASPDTALDYLDGMRTDLAESEPPPALDRMSLRTYCHYADWARKKIQAIAASLSDIQLDRRFDMGHGTIRETLHRTWMFEQSWVDNWILGPGQPVRDVPESLPVTEIARRFDATADARNALLDRIADPDLLQPVHGPGTLNDSVAYPLGVTILYLCFWGTHYRALCGNMLRHVGTTVPETDVAVLLRAAKSVPIEKVATTRGRDSDVRGRAEFARDSTV